MERGNVYILDTMTNNFIQSLLKVVSIAFMDVAAKQQQYQVQFVLANLLLITHTAVQDSLVVNRKRNLRDLFYD